MKLRTGASASGVLVCALLAAACSSSAGSVSDEPVGEASSALDVVDVLEGAYHFGNALPGTNGRSCATCHVESEHFALSPQHVSSLYAQNPHDPLFNPIDADDPTAAVLTYDHVKAGLIRVTLPLADNLDVVDEGGNVITNAARTITVWRGVPTIENTSYTGPYQYDSRAATLQIQADGALHNHSQITYEPSPQVLDQISGFESTIYSSLPAVAVAAAVAEGKTPPPVDLHFPPGSPEAAGQVLFQNICAQCHGTGTTQIIVNTAVHDYLFPVINSDGTIDTTETLPNGVSIEAAYHHDLPTHHDVDIGITGIQGLRQLGVLPALLPETVSFPQYHIRFYTDASRTQKLYDLPPPPSEVGPATAPEVFSTDPGRAIITGDPNDWEGFKVSQLRGVAHTAPYFHDASAPDLATVLEIYSTLILPEIVPLNTPAIYPPANPYGLPESLSLTQKAQLLAFLQYL
jgi:mono/diheme cytochrome c family protein